MLSRFVCQRNVGERLGRLGNRANAPAAHRQRGNVQIVAEYDNGRAPETDSLMRVAWLSIFLSVLLWSAVKPKDYLTWGLEVSPAVIAFIVLWATYRRFRLTNLAYVLVLVHAVILMIGGHYTYAEVPLFESVWELFGSDRNNYDKIGHFAQGFVPAIISREVLIRLRVIEGRKWLNFFVVTFCLAVSAFYELIEWWVAILVDASAESFLGTQGYVWDTQSDMSLALVGAILALTLLSKLHDKQLCALNSEPSRS